MAYGRPGSPAAVGAPRRAPVSARALSTNSRSTVGTSRLALKRGMAAFRRERRSRDSSSPRPAVSVSFMALLPHDGWRERFRPRSWLARWRYGGSRIGTARTRARGGGGSTNRGFRTIRKEHAFSPKNMYRITTIVVMGSMVCTVRPDKCSCVVWSGVFTRAHRPSGFAMVSTHGAARLCGRHPGTFRRQDAAVARRPFMGRRIRCDSQIRGCSTGTVTP